ncbi:LORF1 protein, partial [Crocuta crocuta]
LTKQKNSTLKKFQEEIIAKELLKTDISNITEQEFRTVVIKLVTGLKKGMEDIRETIATKTMEHKNSCDELKNAINEMHNKMEATTARIEEVERRIGELENTIIEKEEAKKKRDKLIQEHERRVQELSDTIKWNIICIIGIPEEEERGKGTEGVLEQIIAENFPYLGKETNIEIQEAQRTPLRRDLNRSSAQH